MKVVIAIDSFKGSLSSMEAGKAAGEGIRRVYPEAEVIIRPIADGGEGTVDALIEGMGARPERVVVTGPLGEPTTAVYGVVGDNTAIMEMSAASGITLVPEADRNPLLTTTYGVGEMIADAAKKGCRRFIIGIGGSATNDGGMLQALGFDLLNEKGEPVAPGAKGLSELVSMTGENALPILSECEFYIACDVVNPLCGKNGCSSVFGPQKGATKQMIEDMDRWLADYATLSKTVNPAANPDTPGAGAAGGLGFAFLTFLGGRLQPGIDLVLEETRLESYVKGADFVLTGEGRLDSQTVMGKAPSGVAAIAKKYGIPVIGLAGAVTEDAGVCNQHGIDAFFPVLRRVCSLEEAMDTENAYRNMADTTEQIFRIIHLTQY